MRSLRSQISCDLDDGKRSAFVAWGVTELSLDEILAHGGQFVLSFESCMQLVLVYGCCSIAINFCPALLDVLALICLPWTFVAAVCRGCIMLLDTAFTKCSILPFCRYQFCCCSGGLD
ncbi:hypothetical protein Nepgr_013714 [Nepenthes gracilis]|uniref:Transmembrane protein n=1 Tax=Nepenthes gracilis TaxID=150966 RepID=A0AAD3SIG0_NEPGR|nr:hypothetical protein Nepgr_013714 [Nepenthes gracilis]